MSADMTRAEPMVAGKRDIAIVGAGLAGSLLAVALGERGYRVSVYERRPDPRAAGFVGGRSINLALSIRGISALESVGLADAVLAEVVPMRGRMMHSPEGALSFQPYSRDPEDTINSVSRGGLNITLLNAAQAHDNVRLHFDHRCLNVDPCTTAITLENERTGATLVERADLIIGADGAFSSVRDALRTTDRFDYSQSYLKHGYKELHIPPTADGGFALEANALHIWPRGGYMMIALPNQDRSFTCTLFWPFHGPVSFDSIRSAEDVQPFFEHHFADAVPLMPTLVDDYMSNPTSSLVTIRCCPWHYDDRVLLLGDAAHALVPFYGQGMNAAFEDVEVFSRMLDQRIDREGRGDWSALLREFSRVRKPNADAIADMALHNFVEMRDHVGSTAFLWGKRLEKMLHGLMPHWFTPLYNMVTFSTIPYAEARRRAHYQRRVLWGAGFATLFAILIAALVALMLSAR